MSMDNGGNLMDSGGKIKWLMEETPVDNGGKFSD